MEKYYEWKKQVIDSFEKPIKCRFCQQIIRKLEGKDQDSVVFFHLDGDTENENIENLAPMHRGCHSRYNNLGIRGTSWKGDDASEKAKKKRHMHPQESIKFTGLRPRLYSWQIDGLTEAIYLKLGDHLHYKTDESKAKMLLHLHYRLSNPAMNRPSYPEFSWEELEKYLVEYKKRYS